MRDFIVQDYCRMPIPGMRNVTSESIVAPSSFRDFSSVTCSASSAMYHKRLSMNLNPARTPCRYTSICAHSDRPASFLPPDVQVNIQAFCGGATLLLVSYLSAVTRCTFSSMAARLFREFGAPDAFRRLVSAAILPECPSLGC